MTRKSLFIVCALTLSVIGIASAKSYSICLSAPARAGAIELKAGDYDLKVQGSQAILTDQEHRKSFSVAVRIEQGGNKFETTTVQESTDKNGKDSIVSITLAGSNTKLVFDQQ